MDNEVNFTLWCGNISSQVTENLLYELFLQVSDNGVSSKIRNHELFLFTTAYFHNAMICK